MKATINNVNNATLLSTATTVAPVTTVKENAMGKTIDARIINAVTLTVSMSLVKKELATPKEALAVAVVFADNLDRLVGSNKKWVRRFQGGIEEVVVGGLGEMLADDFDALGILSKAGFIDGLGGLYFATDRVFAIIDEVKTSNPPKLASVGVNAENRRRGYATVHYSPLFKEATEVLESSKYMASQEMLIIAREVYKLATPEQKEVLMKQDYVLKGTRDMIAGEAYVSEFFGDKRGRQYQADCYGPNGQSSDMARAMMDLHGVSMDYFNTSAYELILAEISDMGSWSDDAHMWNDIKDAVEQPAEFILTHMTKDYHLSKPWNFVKFSKIVHELSIGNKPYIGVAVGLDARCSGPQLAACMIGDEKMLQATGFTQVEVDDAYHNCLAEVEKAGFFGLNRALIKKPFMAVFYGAGKDSMADAVTILQEAWDVLYAGKTPEEIETISEEFYIAIVKSFGVKLNNLRKKIRASYDFEGETTKLTAPIRHTMPDGFEVAMEYMEKLDIEGNVIVGSVVPTATKVEVGLTTKMFTNMTFSTNNYALGDFSRTGFVNMIQATDALLARLIITHANRLGAQHIISVHDCFRVNIHDMPILKEAIKLAYLELFGTETNEVGVNMPHGTDILGLYFKGVAKVTKDEYEPQSGSQFYGKDAYRRLDEVNGVDFTDLVNDLGRTYYFAK